MENKEKLKSLKIIGIVLLLMQIISYTQYDFSQLFTANNTKFDNITFLLGQIFGFLGYSLMGSIGLFLLLIYKIKNKRESALINTNSILTHTEDVKIEVPKQQISNNIKNTKLNLKEKDKLLINYLLETEQRLKIGLIISIIFVVIFGIICLYLALNSNTKDLEKQIATLKSTNSNIIKKNEEYISENLKLQDKSDFLDDNIVFVLDGYGNYYYTYEQVEQVTQGKEYSYWAYNKEQAKGLGYKKFK